MRSATIALVAVAAIALPAAPAAASMPPPATPAVTADQAATATAEAARHCRGRFVHARIGGRAKCIGTGQYCARRHERDYRRYRFACRRDRRGVYRLRRR